MSFGNNGTLQKWHMTKTPPETDKYGSYTKWCLTKMTHLGKYAQRLPCLARTEMSDF